MKIPHKHAEVIKAWADGETIQFYNGYVWVDLKEDAPVWFEDRKYRTKPKSKTPGEIYFKAAYPLASFKGDKDLWERFEDGAKAVIEAYKRGEIDEDCCR